MSNSESSRRGSLSLICGPLISKDRIYKPTAPKISKSSIDPTTTLAMLEEHQATTTTKVSTASKRDAEIVVTRNEEQLESYTQNPCTNVDVPSGRKATTTSIATQTENICSGRLVFAYQLRTRAVKEPAHLPKGIVGTNLEPIIWNRECPCLKCCKAHKSSLHSYENDPTFVHAMRNLATRICEGIFSQTAIEDPITRAKQLATYVLADIHLLLTKYNVRTTDIQWARFVYTIAPNISQHWLNTRVFNTVIEKYPNDEGVISRQIHIPNTSEMEYAFVLKQFLVPQRHDSAGRRR